MFVISKRAITESLYYITGDKACFESNIVDFTDFCRGIGRLCVYAENRRD